jgi:hypothetical protein
MNQKGANIILCIQMGFYFQTLFISLYTLFGEISKKFYNKVSGTEEPKELLFQI